MVFSKQLLPAEPGSTYPRASVISLALSLGSYQSIQESIITAARQGQSGTICFANVHMCVEAHHNPDIARAVNKANWVVADGVPLLWAMRLLYGVKQERITGLDMLPSLLERAAKEKLPVFFYGSTDDVLAQTVRVCRQNYPSLKIAGTLSPPFRALTADEEIQISRQITASGAKLVFVALGCPKQEVWLDRMRSQIPSVLLAIGGALPVLAGEVSRSPNWMQRWGLEWFYRFLQEPRRLFKRYAVTNSLFLYYLAKQRIKGFGE